MRVSILVAINQLFNHFKDITDMYDSLYRNLRLWTVISNESSFGKIGQVEARSKQDFIKFYKVLATVENMDFEQMKAQFLALLNEKTLVNATISQPRQKSNEVKRVKLKPIELKGVYTIQLEYQYERILKHENIPLDAFASKFDLLLEQFRQIHAQFTEQAIHVQLSKKNKVLWKSDKQTTVKEVNLSHNRKKQYLLDDATPYPFLIRLGVHHRQRVYPQQPAGARGGAGDCSGRGASDLCQRKH